VANGGAFGVGHLGLLGGGSGTGGGGAPLAHGFRTQQESRKWRWKGGTAGAMCEEEDGGGGVGRTVHPATVIYSTSINLRQISAAHGEAETTKQIRPSTCQRASTAASTTHGNQGNRADYFSPMRGTCGQTLSMAATCGLRAHQTSRLGRVRPVLQKMR
jgi:hypothetical protein